MPENPVIILSRTDSIGDVVLTLPMAGYIKKHIPGTRIIFLGRSYTREVIALSEHVDEFVNYDELEKCTKAHQVKKFSALKADCIVHVFPKKAIAALAKKAGIKTRIGTTNRVWHWLYCNKLVKLSRRNSPLHEARLNFELLKPLGLNTSINTAEIKNYYGFTRLPDLPASFSQLIDAGKKNIILHPRSKGSAREWGLDNFEKLISALPADKYKIFVSGTKQDGDSMRGFLDNNKKLTDITGTMTLAEFVGFIAACDALVAASTGPLHIASALGKKAIGLYSPRRPIHPGRWMPLGQNAHALVFDENCKNCAAGKDCNCITQISPQQIVDLLEQ